tara:strand:- start:837 stop:1592 length:756 start_codon:yes stop_codon:yes gene_type:complete
MIGVNTIKFIRSLRLKKNRLIDKKVILEGFRLICESINAGIKIDYIIVIENFESDLLNQKQFRHQSIKYCSKNNFRKISDTKNSQGIIAVADIKKYSNQSLDVIKNNNLVILDGIQDPGNLGTIMRTSVWYGVNSIALTQNTVDPFNLKCIRSAMGAHFYLNNIIQDSCLNIINYLKNNYQNIYVADMQGENLHKIKSNGNWALILGSEAHGINSNFKQFKQITIKKFGQLESLNVSVASGILMNHLRNNS